MKRLVKVSVEKSTIKWPNLYLIKTAELHGVFCYIVSKNLDTFNNTYILALSGTYGNIHNFLHYLKLEGFKIVE